MRIIMLFWAAKALARLCVLRNSSYMGSVPTFRELVQLFRSKVTAIIHNISKGLYQIAKAWTALQSVRSLYCARNESIEKTRPHTRNLCVL